MAQQETEFICAVKGCNKPNDSLYFKFPNPEKHEKLFMGWVAATGDDSLLGHHPLEIFYSRRICQKHFEQKYFNAKSDLMPAPYLHVPKPISVPRTWIISMIDTLEIDDRRSQTPPAYQEEDIIETSDFVKFSYTTCSVKNWFLYRNMFMIAENSSDDEESCLWSVPRNVLKRDPEERNACQGGNIDNIGKSVHYILTSPTEYYSLKFKSLLKLHKRAMEECEKLRKENRNLNRKIREMKKMLYMKHI